MHEADIQNWLNHARSVGYTDTELRTLMLKAGWAYQQVNDIMTSRGLAPGSAAANPKGKVVPRRLEKHVEAQMRHYLKIGLAVIFAVATWMFAYWLWQR